MDYSLFTLPPACDGVNPCTDQGCQRAIADTHIISEQEFQSRILDEAGEPKVIAASDMQRILDAGSCGADVIVFDQNVATNAELSPHPAPQAGGKIAYSYPMLKGILSLQPETFSYYIASGSAGRDVIFKVEFAEEPVRFYDRSQDWP